MRVDLVRREEEGFIREDVGGQTRDVCGSPLSLAREHVGT